LAGALLKQQQTVIAWQEEMQAVGAVVSGCRPAQEGVVEWFCVFKTVGRGGEQDCCRYVFCTP